MPTSRTPATAYHTAVTMLAQAILLPAEEQVPWVNKVARLAAGAMDEADQAAWLKMRSKMHDAVRKTTAIAQQLAERFEEFELQNPAAIRQLDLFRTPRDVPFMGSAPDEQED